MRAVRASLGADSLAARHRACLVALAGLPGSGKSHLAHALHGATNAVVLRTDEVRRVLFPKPTYSPEESGVVYLTCFATVRALLHDKYTVVFDGTNGRRAGRRLFAAIARIEAADYVSVLVHAAPDLVRERIERRVAGMAPAFGSDAGVAIYEKMSTTEEYGGRFDLVVDAGLDIGPAVRRLVAFIDGQGPIDGEGSEA